MYVFDSATNVTSLSPNDCLRTNICSQKGRIFLLFLYSLILVPNCRKSGFNVSENQVLLLCQDGFVFCVFANTKNDNPTKSSNQQKRYVTVASFWVFSLSFQVVLGDSPRVKFSVVDGNIEEENRREKSHLPSTLATLLLPLMA